MSSAFDAFDDLLADIDADLEPKKQPSTPPDDGGDVGGAYGGAYDSVDDVQAALAVDANAAAAAELDELLRGSLVVPTSATLKKPLPVVGKSLPAKPQRRVEAPTRIDDNDNNDDDDLQADYAPFPSGLKRNASVTAQTFQGKASMMLRPAVDPNALEELDDLDDLGVPSFESTRKAVPAAQSADALLDGLLANINDADDAGDAHPAYSTSAPALKVAATPIILTVNIEHIATTKKMKFTTDMTVATVIATVQQQLAKMALINGDEEFVFLFGSATSTPLQPNFVLGGQQPKPMDNVYLRLKGGAPPSASSAASSSSAARAAHDENTPGNDAMPPSASLVLTINVPLAKAVKKIKFSGSDTVGDACGMVAAVLLKSHLLEEKAKNTPFCFYRRENGTGKIEKNTPLRATELKAGDVVYMLDMRDPEQKLAKFDRSVLAARKDDDGKAKRRVDVLLPRAVLEYYKSAAQSAAGLLHGATLVGYMTKEGSGVKSWRRRLFVLHGQSLYYFVTDEDLEPKGRLDLTPSTVVRNEDGKKQRNCFSVTIAKRTLFVYTDEEWERDEWKAAITKAAQSGAQSHSVAHEATHTLLTTLWLSEARDSLADALKTAVTIVANDYAYDVIDHPDDAAWGWFKLDDSPLASDTPVSDLAECVQVRPLEPSKLSSAAKGGSTFSRLLSRGQDLVGSVTNSIKNSASGGGSGGGGGSSSAAAPASKSKPGSSKEETKLAQASGEYKGKVVIAEAVKNEDVKLVDTSVVRSKPKVGGRKAPTRRKKVEIALDRSEIAPDLDFDLTGGDDAPDSSPSLPEVSAAPARPAAAAAVDRVISPRPVARASDHVPERVVSPKPITRGSDHVPVSPRMPPGAVPLMGGTLARGGGGTLARGGGGATLSRGGAAGRGGGAAPARGGAVSDNPEDLPDVPSAGSSGRTLPRGGGAAGRGRGAPTVEADALPDAPSSGRGAGGAARGTLARGASAGAAGRGRGAPVYANFDADETVEPLERAKSMPRTDAAQADAPKSEGRALPLPSRAASARGGAAAPGRSAAPARGGRALPTPAARGGRGGAAPAAAGRGGRALPQPKPKAAPDVLDELEALDDLALDAEENLESLDSFRDVLEGLDTGEFDL